MPHNHLGCQSVKDYFTEQLLTILMCGALAFVGIGMYFSDMLPRLLVPAFHNWVLGGSLSVLVLVLVRALAVWREAGELQQIDTMSCQENHVHNNACNHLPGLPTGDTPDAELMDDHGHSHDIVWVFVRMLVLVIPVSLYFLGFPMSPPKISASAQNKLLGNEKALNLDSKALEEMAKDTQAVELEKKREADGTVIRVVQSVPTLDAPNGLKIRETIQYGTGVPKYVLVSDAGSAMTFNELNDAAYDADKRKVYSGQTAIMEGRFRRLADKEFTLYRMKMTCCGADAVPLKVRIVAPQAVNGFGDHDWVRIKGVIQFIKLPGQEQYAPVLRLADITDIEHAEVGNEYEY